MLPPLDQRPVESTDTEPQARILKVENEVTPRRAVARANDSGTSNASLRQPVISERSQRSAPATRGLRSNLRALRPANGE